LGARLALGSRTIDLVKVKNHLVEVLGGFRGCPLRPRCSEREGRGRREGGRPWARSDP
jgi:hypothetical protein